MRDGFAYHWRESYVCETGKSTNAMELAVAQEDCCCNIAISLVEVSCSANSWHRFNFPGYVFPDSDFLNHAGFAATRSGQGVTLKEVSQRALRSIAPFVKMSSTLRESSSSRRGHVRSRDRSSCDLADPHHSGGL